MTDILTKLAALTQDMSVLNRKQPCGCVICRCADEERCRGCGAKNCGSHAPGDFPEGGVWTFLPSKNEADLIALVREAAGEIERLSKRESGKSCPTCNGRGEVGGFVNAESGYQTDPCPACTPKNREISEETASAKRSREVCGND